MKVYQSLFIISCCFLGLQVQAQKQTGHDLRKRTLIVFFDGLRPDYITPQAMPRLYAFKQKSAYGMQHHSVFPTVTRVNSASYSTGSYPSTHGLMGNIVYFPQVYPARGLNTGDARELQKVITATNGKLLTAISLGEILQAHGQKMMVFSSGSTGQALLQNHTISGGAIVNPSMILPESLKDSIFKELGPVPPGAKHQWVTDALIHYGFAQNGPLVNAIWFSDPDGAAHEHGIGSPEAMASIRVVDEQFGRIIDTLKSRGLDRRFNILISTDHGFMTYIGKGQKSVAQILIDAGLKKGPTSDDVVIAGGAIYVKDHDQALIEKIVDTLRPLEFIGALFTKGAKRGDVKGIVDGTLSFESIHWDHSRSADILLDANWDDRKNNAGYAGASYISGVAGHGSLTPYDVHIPFIAAGPDFKSGLQSELPTSNVDLAPTVLYLSGIKVPPSMDGRILDEFLKKPAGKVLSSARQDTIETSVRYPQGTYHMILERTVVGKYTYVNSAKAERIPVAK